MSLFHGITFPMILAQRFRIHESKVLEKMMDSGKGQALRPNQYQSQFQNLDGIFD